ncbi:MAG: hypothetical protein AAGM46_27020 [Cyanobacteria bacterium J06582_2]
MDPKDITLHKPSEPKEPHNPTPSSQGAAFVTIAPYTPASAATNLASSSKEAPETKTKKKISSIRNPFKPISKQQLEDLFSIRFDFWTSFFIVTDTGILTN